MGFHVVSSGALLIRACAERDFLHAWGEGFVENHRHTWEVCRAPPRGRYGESPLQWRHRRADRALDRASPILEMIAPHVAHARLRSTRPTAPSRTSISRSAGASRS